MFDIPKNLRKEVMIIVDNIENYENKKKLSWNKSYIDVLTKLDKVEKASNGKLLNYVVKEITSRGYDIIDNPFKLERYK